MTDLELEFAYSDEFTCAYIECALGSSHDESREDGGNPMDQNFGIEDIHWASLSIMIGHCRRFCEAMESTIEGAEYSRGIGEYSKQAQAGHDFWLNRNGHGAGFWDGDWSEPQATRLDQAAKAFGECDLYIGDDGRIHCT